MTLNFFKLYLIRIISIIFIFFTFLFIGQLIIPNMDQYYIVPILIAIILSPRIKQVELQSGTEIHLSWFGNLLAKLPKN